MPSTAATFRKWLTVWGDIQAAPSTTNAELAERHRVAERTITNIRRAGRDGMLTEGHLQRLQGAEPVAATETAANADAVAADAVMAGGGAETSDRVSGLAPGAGSAATPTVDADPAEPVDDAGVRGRRKALVG